MQCSAFKRAFRPTWCVLMWHWHSKDLRYDSQTGSHLGCDDPPGAMQSNKDHAIIQTLLAQSEVQGRKATTLYVYVIVHNMSPFLVAWLLNRWQRRSLQEKAVQDAYKEDQRLDHATKLEASLSWQFRCHDHWDWGAPAPGTVLALLSKHFCIDSFPFLFTAVTTVSCLITNFSFSAAVSLRASSQLRKQFNLKLQCGHTSKS
jgi:hypothetical protein